MRAYAHTRARANTRAYWLLNVNNQSVYAEPVTSRDVIGSASGLNFSFQAFKLESRHEKKRSKKEKKERAKQKRRMSKKIK